MIRPVRRRERLFRGLLILSATGLLGLAACSGGGTAKPAANSAPAIDPCSLLGDAAASAAMGEPLANVHEPVRFDAVTQGVYGFQCKWVGKTGSSSVEVLIWPPPGGATIYNAATHILAGDEVSPRPGTTLLDGVPGVAITLPSEVQFMAPQGLVGIVIGSYKGRAFEDNVARTLAAQVAANLGKLNHG